MPHDIKISMLCPGDKRLLYKVFFLRFSHWTVKRSLLPWMFRLVNNIAIAAYQGRKNVIIKTHAQLIICCSAPELSGNDIIYYIIVLPFSHTKNDIKLLFLTKSWEIKRLFFMRFSTVILNLLFRANPFKFIYLSGMFTWIELFSWLR